MAKQTALSLSTSDSMKNSTAEGTVSPSSSTSLYGDDKESEKRETLSVQNANATETPVSLCSTSAHNDSQNQDASHTDPLASEHNVSPSSWPLPCHSPAESGDTDNSTISDDADASPESKEANASIAPTHSGLSRSDGIPVEQFDAVLWARKPCGHNDSPKAKAWLVRTDAIGETGTNAKVWTSPEFIATLRSVHPASFQQNPNVAKVRVGGFKYGRPLINVSVALHTCAGEARPRTLYRAIHDQMPFDGIGARGLEVVTTNGLFFQRHLQNHFTWICRQPSPFLSTSSERWRAVSFAAAFDARGHTGIKVLEISTTGEHWDHHISRLWEVRHLLEDFRLPRHEYHKNEYFVENLIPKEHITIYDWDDPTVRELLDPGACHQDRQRETMKINELKFAELNEYKKRQREEQLHGEDSEDAKPWIARTTKFKAVISQARKMRSITNN